MIQTAPAGPPLLHARHRALDAHDQAALLPGFEQQYRQLSRGPFEGEVEFAVAGELLALKERNNRRLLETIRAPRGALTVAVCDGGGGEAGWMGACVGSGHLLVSPTREPLEYLAPEGAGIFGVSVPAALADALLGRSARDRLADGLVAACPAGAARLRASIDAWLAAATAAPAAPACVDATCDELLSGVGAALGACAADPRSGPVSPSRGHALVRRARALVDEHTEQPLTVGALCQALGVSRRRLQQAFVQSLGVGPLHYLRAERMNRAHLDLKRARPGADTVAGVATRWGFWHLGRFSVDYRRMFGVAPSQTLARAARADFG
jgi:AraC family ethanolamine operon transcriptional activator